QLVRQGGLGVAAALTGESSRGGGRRGVRQRGGGRGDRLGERQGGGKRARGVLGGGAAGGGPRGGPGDRGRCGRRRRRGRGEGAAVMRLASACYLRGATVSYVNGLPCGAFVSRKLLPGDVPTGA